MTSNPPDVSTPAGILRLGNAFCDAKALLTAVELDLFTILREQPEGATVDWIRERLLLHGRGLRDFLDLLVALKMLRPSALVDGEQLERLKSEIKLARKITHPNVLRTFDFGEVDGQPFISMEYVRGLTLRYLLSETRRIPYTAGLRIARQLCAGLAAAHEVGVLHRDIKPENLILEQNGNAKLMDFGIARPIRRSGPGHTEQGSFVGTPNYSPPEQLAGEDVDQRADIYSSGVLMCEMFCGKLPFSGSNTMEIYIAQTQQEPIKPSAYWPEIPPALVVMFATWPERPGIFSEAPSTISIFSTASAEIFERRSKIVSDLRASRSPLIRTLTLASPRPRFWSLAPVTEKPGTWLSMSSAFFGEYRAKSAGV